MDNMKRRLTGGDVDVQMHEEEEEEEENENPEELEQRRRLKGKEKLVESHNYEIEGNGFYAMERRKMEAEVEETPENQPSGASLKDEKPLDSRDSKVSKSTIPGPGLLEKRGRKSSLGSALRLNLSLKKWKSGDHDKKASDNVFKQQRMPDYQILLFPSCVIFLFLFFSLLFISIGVAILATFSNPSIVLYYTDCDILAGSNFSTNPEIKYPNAMWKYNNETSICTIQFETANIGELPGPFILYYGLSNYFQNHRKFVKSLCSNQLLGQAVLANSSYITNCAPLSVTPNNEAVYYPCGLIANSMFNDTFSNLTSQNGSVFGLIESGLAWPEEFAKFGNPQYTPAPNGTFTTIIPPPNWSAYNGIYTNLTIPMLGENEHFMVWMRTASGPTFEKPYSRSLVSLPPGTWTINILTRYPVRPFQGTKHIAIRSQTWLSMEGADGVTLGTSYLALGAFLLIFTFFLVLGRIFFPRRLGDERLLSWNKID